MTSSKIHRGEKLQTRRKIADYMISGAIPWYLDVGGSARNIVEGRAEEYIATLHYLILKGCDPRSLSVVLDLGAALKARDGKYFVPRAKTVKALALKMKRLAKAISAVESSYFLTILNRQETAQWYAEKKLGPEHVDDLTTTFPFLALPKWLEKRATMYEAWSRLASEKVPPKELGLARLARVCLAMYVKYSTGSTYFPKVMTLLECAGLGRCNAAQLSRELKDFESNYPWSCDHLRIQFKMLDPDPTNRNWGTLIVGGIQDDLLQPGKRFHHRVRRASTHPASSAGSKRH